MQGGAIVESPPDGLRERKKAATRVALHRAALELVEERGLARVSVNDIAMRADAAPRTFFNYFASKADAVLGLDPADVRRMMEALAQRPGGETRLVAVRAVLREYTQAMTDDVELWSQRLRVIDSNPPLEQRLASELARIERDVAETISQRAASPAGADFDPALLASLQGSVLRISLQRWLASDFTAFLPDLLDECWRGIAVAVSPSVVSPRAVPGRRG